MIIRASGGRVWLLAALPSPTLCPAPPCAGPSAGHWGPGWMDESDGPACGNSQPSSKDSQGNRVTVMEDEQRGQGHQTAPKLPGDSQGGGLEEGLRARP